MWNRLLRSTVIGAAALAMVGAAGAPAAQAHAGGRAQLYLDDVRITPARDGWVVLASLIDSDSGQPQPGFTVQANGTGPSGATFGPVDLADGSGRGRYSATIHPPPGPWAVTVSARQSPGGPAAIPVTKRYDVTLIPGQTPTLGRRRTPVGGTRGDSLWPVLLGLVLSGAAAVEAARRHRHRPPAPSEPSDSDQKGPPSGRIRSVH